MGDGFSINLSNRDLKDIYDRYSTLKLDHEKSKADMSSTGYLVSYFLFAGFEECLRYVGIDPRILKNGIEPLE